MVTGSYSLFIVDDFRYNWVYLMHSKVETINVLLKFTTHALHQFNTKTKIIRPDKEQEYTWSDLYEKMGIVY